MAKLHCEVKGWKLSENFKDADYVQDGARAISSEKLIFRWHACQGHSHPKLSVAQGVGSRSSADKVQPTACRPMATGNAPVWFPGH